MPGFGLGNVAFAASVPGAPVLLNLSVNPTAVSNQINFAANVTPPATAVEASYDSGNTFNNLAMSVVGNQLQGLLTQVPGGTYAVGTILLRAVGYPSSSVLNPTAVYVSNAYTTVYTALY